MKKTAMGLSPREQRKQAFRDKIMGTAIELFEAQGFADTTLEQICEKAGVSRPTFYSYYATKDELIQALGENLWLHVTGEYAAASMAGDQTTEDFVRAFFQLVGQEITQYSRLERMLVERSMGRDSATRMGVLRKLTGLFEGVYRRGLARGEVTTAYPVDFLAEMTMGCINAVMMNWATADDYPVIERLRQLADLVCERVIKK